MLNLEKLKKFTKDMSVLYVEDDKIIRDEIEEFLKKIFPVVDLADNGEDGLKYYKEGNYDLVINDINMPKMNGIEMSKAILKDNPEQPIIINSAYNDSEYLLELINSGIKHYALKPVNIKQLMKVIYKIAKARYDKNITQLQNESIIKHTSELEKSLKEKGELIKHHINKNSLTDMDNLCSLMHNIKKDNQNKMEFTIILLIDIDNLHYINNIYGTDTGNKILIAFSNFLKNFIKDKSYKIYHTAGDQFVLQDKVAYIDTDKYEIDLNDLQEQIKTFSIYLDEIDKEIDITATIGISMGKEYSHEHASMALDYAKKNHKPYEVYNLILDSTKETKQKIKWQLKIIKAIEKDRIIPVFQPIVDRNGIIVKYEALMRLIEMENNKEKLFSPAKFLKIAIDSKYYSSISEIMINKVFDSLKTHKYDVSINLTYSDINNKIFMHSIYERIAKENIGSRLIVEVTEEENINDYKILKESIKKFRNLGAKIAIDDFGSHYANFNHILEMHPEYVKIDGSIVKDIDTDSHAFILTKAITSFCHELGIKVIAEYVHSEDIYNILKTFEVDEFQGFYFSEPLKNINKNEIIPKR